MNLAAILTLEVLTLCIVESFEPVVSSGALGSSMLSSDDTDKCRHDKDVIRKEKLTRQDGQVKGLSVGQYKENGDSKLLNPSSRYLQKRGIKTTSGPKLLGSPGNKTEGPNPEDAHDVCPLGYALNTKRNECVRKATQYVVKLLVFPTTAGPQPDLTRKIWVTADELKPHVKTMIDRVNASRYFYTVARLKEEPSWRTSMNISTSYVQLTLWFQVLDMDIPNGDILKAVLQGLRKNISVWLNDQEVHLDVILFNGSYPVQDQIQLFSDPQTGRCCYSRMAADDFYEVTSEKIIFNEMSCRFKLLYRAFNYTFKDNSVVLLFPNLELISEHLDRNDFTFHGDNAISVCNQVYRSLYNYTMNQENVETKQTWIGKNRRISRILCMCVSLFCLFVILITYFVLPALRTLFNAINMALVVSILLAQGFYLASVFTSKDNLLCRIFGVCIHYFWLASMFWLTVCSFHVFSHLSKSTTISNQQSGSWCIIARYLLFANGIPVLVVMGVIGSRQALYRGADIGYNGYGEDVCFLASPFLIQAAAIAPMALTLLINTVFLVSSCVVERRRRSRVANATDRPSLWIYVTHSAITAVFLTLAMLGAKLQIPAMEYSSIFLNGGHGVFLFCAFCCNARVAGLWLDVCRKRDVSVMTMDTLFTCKSDTQPFGASLNASYIGILPEFHEYATPIPPPTPARNPKNKDFSHTLSQCDDLYDSPAIYSTPYTK